MALAEEDPAAIEAPAEAGTSATNSVEAAGPADNSETAAPAASEHVPSAPETEPVAPAPVPIVTETENAGASGGGSATPPANSHNSNSGQPGLVAPVNPGPITGLVVNISRDGTDTFDANNDPGNDAGAQNGIVRVNDTVTYEVNVNSGNTAAVNPTFTIRFPKGMEITELPGMCRKDGSSIVPATAGSPRLPLTNDSINELEEQVLTCNLGSFDPNKSVKYFVTAKVVNLAKQGQQLPLLAASMTSDGQASPVTSPTLPTVTASAALRWDISKNGISQVEDTGYVYGPAAEVCPWDTKRLCFITTYPLLLSAPANGKGAMPAIGDITVMDDVSPERLYPHLSAEQIALIKADLNKYGTRVEVSDANYNIPGTKAGTRVNGVDYTITNSVRDSGTLRVEQAGPGQPAKFTISGADMTLRTVPRTVTRPVGGALPANVAYAVSRTFNVYTPVDVVRDFGSPDNEANPSEWTLQTRNTFTDLKIGGFDGTVQAPDVQPTTNDYRTTISRVTVNGDFSKYFAGSPAAPGNMTPRQFNPPWASLGEGMPGGSTLGSGTANVARGQEIISMLLLRGAPITYPVGKSFVACDSWDNSLLHLKVKDWPASPTAEAQYIGSNGPKAVWLSGYNNVPNAANTDAVWTTDASLVPQIRVQYSAVKGGSGNASICDDTTGPWYNTPAEVPGNDATKAAQGIYTGVARVRVHTYLPAPVNSFRKIGNGYAAAVSIGMEIADTTQPDGTVIPNWAAVKRVTNQELDMDGVLSARSAGWGKSSYTPGDSISAPRSHVGNPGDRVILSGPQARIAKSVRVVNQDADATQSDFTKVTPVVSGDPAAKKNLIEYELRPSLISGALTPGQHSDLVLEDCMPSGVNFVSANIAPMYVGASKPGDWGSRDCDANETWIRWFLPHQQVNSALTPILVRAQVSPTAADGVYRNDVVVSAPGDNSLVSFRSDAVEVQINNPAGVYIEKKALTPVLQVNAANSEHVELNKWRVALTNTLPSTDASDLSNVDFIDVLPRRGLAGNSTSHSGTFEFHSARELLGDNTVQILYTKAADVAVVVADPSNGANGSTAWCDAPAGGTRVSGTGDCPATAAEVTGLRVKRPGRFSTKGSVQIELSMLARGNVKGDTYQNFAAGRVDGLRLPVGPVNATETAIASSLGNFVWEDRNGNGVQDTAEPGVSGVKVTLTGTDDLGNPVNLSTTTDGDGHYSFPALRASSPEGYSVKFELTAEQKANKYEFTGTKMGLDTEKDSDADAAGMVTGVVIGRNMDDQSIDAGIAKPSIALVKSANKQTVRAGDVVTYTFTATNNGSTTLKDVVLTDTAFTNGKGQTIEFDAAPAVDAAQSTGAIDNMPVGSTIVWTATYTVKAEDLEENTSIDNTANVTAKSPRETPVRDEDNEKLTPFGSGSYVFSKTANPAKGAKVLVGDTIVYTITVKHRGELAVKGATLTDDLSAVLDDADYLNDVSATSGTATITGNTLNWNGNLAVGATATITYSVKAKKGGDMALRNVVTTTNAKGSCDDTVGCETNHNIEPGTFVFHKTAAPAAGETVNVGDTVQYTVTVEHEKGSAIDNATLTDDLAAVLDDATLVDNSVRATIGDAQVNAGKLTWTGDLAVGATATITYSVRVGSEGDGQLRNTVTTTHDKGRCKPQQVCETSHQVQPGKFVFSKTADAATGSVVKVGQTVKYTVAIEHASGTKVKNAVVTDDLSAVLDDATYLNDVEASAGQATVANGQLTWTGDIPVGAKITVTYSVRVGSEGDGTLRNVVTTTGDSGSCKPAQVCETNHQVEPGKFVYYKTSAPAVGATVNVGDTVRYTVTIAHASGTKVKNATVVDNMAAVLDDAEYLNDVQASAGQATVANGRLTWTGDIPVGETIIVTYSVRVGSAGDGTLRNVVTSPNDSGSCKPAQVCETNHQVKDGTFTFSKTSDPVKGDTPPVAVGSQIEYTVTIKHADGTKIKGAVVTDDLSAVLDDATLVEGSVTASAGNAHVAGNTLTWTGDIPVGATITVKYKVTVGSAGDGTLRNVVTSNTPGGSCDATVGCETNHQVEPGKFVFSKVANPANGAEVRAGDKVVYTLTVRHTSGTRIDDARIVDDLAKVLDDATYNEDVEASDGKAEVKDGKLTWEGKLAVGGKVTITFSVTVKDGGDNKLLNVVVSDHPQGACDDAVGCQVEHPKKPPVPGQPPVPGKPDKPGKVGKLPKTGAAVFATSASALTLMALGGAFVLLRRRRNS
ncbi:MAG: SdrD B-like domain-containing protein [Buchananella hordeovulneris]|nr:SdrD B-like domain-containing protein [Buchananella hordeovulneris]